MNRITTDNYEAFLLDFMEGRLDADAVQELKAFVLAHPQLEIDLEDTELPTLEEEALEFDLKMNLKKNELPQSDDELLFDFLEGQLDEVKRKAIESNLLDNKILATELEQWRKTILQPDRSEIYPTKAELHKTDDHLVTANRVLAYYEQQLGGSEKLEFEAELATNPQLRNELAAYKATHLTADAGEVYPDKAGLKKQNKVIVLFSLRSITAMAAALLLLTGLFVLFGNRNQTDTGVQQVAVRQPAKSGQPAVSTPSLNNTLPAYPTHPANAEPSGLRNTKAEKEGNSSSELMKNTPAPEPAPTNGLAEFKAAPASSVYPVKEGVSPEQGALLAQRVKEKDSTVASDPVQLENTELLAKQTLLAVAEDTDDEESQGKTGFFKKAARLAKRAHQLGIKGIDGNEGRQRLSVFNSFSVEKH